MDKWDKTGCISIFDHWLDEKEADSCGYLTYSLAKNNHCLEKYFEGEHNFLKLYTSLSEIVHYLDGETYKKVNVYSIEFKEVLLSSLREKRMSLFDLYYPELSLRVMGGYDRTDNFFISGDSHLEKLISRVKQSIYIRFEKIL